MPQELEVDEDVDAVGETDSNEERDELDEEEHGIANIVGALLS